MAYIIAYCGNARHTVYILCRYYTCTCVYTCACCNCAESCIYLRGKLIVLCVAQCHMAMTQVHLFQWSNSDSVDGMVLLSVSTLCLTQFLMLASHVW